jgi:hypothetical protein
MASPKGVKFAFALQLPEGSMIKLYLGILSLLVSLAFQTASTALGKQCTFAISCIDIRYERFGKCLGGRDWNHAILKMSRRPNCPKSVTLKFVDEKGGKPAETVVPRYPKTNVAISCGKIAKATVFGDCQEPKVADNDPKKKPKSASGTINLSGTWRVAIKANGGSNSGTANLVQRGKTVSGRQSLKTGLVYDVRLTYNGAGTLVGTIRNDESKCAVHGPNAFTCTCCGILNVVTYYSR